jgi:hypothetical protein
MVSQWTAALAAAAADWILSWARTLSKQPKELVGRKKRLLMPAFAEAI